MPSPSKWRCSRCSNIRGRWSRTLRRRPSSLGTRRRIAARSGQDQYGGATAGFLGALGQNPQNVTAGQLANTNLDPYMNPYTKNVIDKTMPIYQQQLGAAAERAAERGQCGQRLRRLAAGRAARRHPGAGRAGHGADGGWPEPRQLPAGATRRDGRHRQPPEGRSGQPAARRRRSTPTSRRRAAWATSATR